MQRVLQPPINPALRDPERHTFWAGVILGVAGVVLIVVGARHLTGIETLDDNPASEMQLVKAFSSGGIKYPALAAQPPKPVEGDPAATARALDRWAREQANASSAPWKIRVDTDAKTPCPT